MGIFQSKRRSPEQSRRSEKREVTEADKAVLSLKTQRRKLSAERKQLEGLVLKGVAEAKEFIRSKRRERALLALRKNKLYEHSLDRIDAYLLNVEQVLSDIQQAQQNNRLFAALKEGNTALAQLQKQVTLEQVAQLNEDAAEAKEYQDTLRELLSQSLSAEDDAAALDELQQIEDEERLEKGQAEPDVQTPAALEQEQPHERLPDVPTHEVPKSRTDQPERQPKAAVLA